MTTTRATTTAARTARAAGPWGRVLPPLLAVAAVLVGWEAAVRVLDVDAWFLPSPTRIVAEGVAAWPSLTKHLVATSQLTLVGLVLGVAVGLAVAAVLHVVPLLDAAVSPLLVVSQNVPTIAIAPLLVVWFGFGLAPKLIVIVLVVFFPVAVATMTGLRAGDRATRDYLEMSGASRRQIFWHLEVPSSLPGVFSGLRIATTYAVMGAVIAEWVGSDKGLGHYMILQKSAFRADRLFVAIALVVLLSLVLYGLVVRAERRTVTWGSPRVRS